MARQTMPLPTERSQFDSAVDIGRFGSRFDAVPSSAGERRSRHFRQVIKRIFILASLIIAATALLYFYGGHQAPPGQASLTTLTSANVAEFQRVFNQAEKEVRLVVLLSPT
jgi:hypothetical protein